MKVAFFSAEGWESWAVSDRPVIPEGMPVLVDDDLLFEDGQGLRPASVASQWLRLRPSEGCSAPRSWDYYARILRDWLVFAAAHGVDVFGDRGRLKTLLSAYAVARSFGCPERHLRATTWNQHMSVLSAFYRWAMAEGYAAAEPFTYRQATATYGEAVHETSVTLARRRTPKDHVTIRYLEPGFAETFVRAMAGLRPDGSEDEGPDQFHGRHLARNAAVTELALATGLRLQEFTHLLACELPPLPPRPTELPIPFPVPAKIAKGGKFRVTWISYRALARVHAYVELERLLAVEGSSWRPPPRSGPPLCVRDADARGGRINGCRLRWDALPPGQRRRLVGPNGGTMMLAARSDGGPFTAWSSLFARTSKRITARFEPRFPHVHPHRTRHTFAMTTLERLVSGYYEQAARLASSGEGGDRALAHYLTTAEPLLVLRDLLGHSSVLVTEKYLRRLDMTRIFHDAWESAGRRHGLLEDEDQADREAAEEFDDAKADV